MQVLHAGVKGVSKRSELTPCNNNNNNMYIANMLLYSSIIYFATFVSSMWGSLRFAPNNNNMIVHCEHASCLCGARPNKCIIYSV